MLGLKYSYEVLYSTALLNIFAFYRVLWINNALNLLEKSKQMI